MGGVLPLIGKRLGLGVITLLVVSIIIFGAVERVRPKMMTVIAIMAGLLPIFWGHGAGADTMRRIAAPMIGGMVSSTILTLIVIPAIYAVWKSWSLKIGQGEGNNVHDDHGRYPA